MAHSRHINPSHLSNHQLKELRKTHRMLRRLNRAVLVHVIRLHSCDQQRDIGKLLAVYASQINSLVALCKQIIESDQPMHYVVAITYECPMCSKKEPLENQSESSSLPSTLHLDSTWIAELDRSLELVFRTEERTFLRCLPRGVLADRLFSSFIRLRNALLRQKSYLMAISPKQTIPIVELEQGHTCTCSDRSTESDLKARRPNAAGDF